MRVVYRTRAEGNWARRTAIPYISSLDSTFYYIDFTALFLNNPNLSDVNVRLRLLIRNHIPGSIEIKATRVEEDSSCVCDCAACTTLMDSLAANEPTDEESSPTEESSPLEKNWVHILNDIKDVGK